MQIEIKKNTRPIDVDILEKTATDFLQPVVLRILDDRIMLVDPDSRQSLGKDKIWRIDQVESLVVRSRHEHLDIRYLPILPNFTHDQVFH